MCTTSAIINLVPGNIITMEKSFRYQQYNAHEYVKDGTV